MLFLEHIKYCLEKLIYCLNKALSTTYINNYTWVNQKVSGFLLLTKIFYKLKFFFNFQNLQIKILKLF